MHIKATEKFYIADDGKEFNTREECKHYENQLMFKAVKGLNEAKVNTLLAGEDATLGKILHKLWRLHEVARREKEGTARVKRTKEERLDLRLAKAREILAEHEAQNEDSDAESDDGFEDFGNGAEHEAHA